MSTDTDTSVSVGGEDTASLLDTVKVFDINGNAFPISDLWKHRKAVVAFARHFGSVCSSLYVKMFQKMIELQIFYKCFRHQQISQMYHFSARISVTLNE